MAQVTKPSKALLVFGILFLLIGIDPVATAIFTAFYPPLEICKGVQGYHLDLKAVPEVTIELKPDCWSGEFTADSDKGIYWVVDGTQPYDVLYADGHISERSRIINDTTKESERRRPRPLRFRGTGKIIISLYNSRKGQ